MRRLGIWCVIWILLLIGSSKLDIFNIKISKIHRDHTQIMFEGVYVKLSQIWKNDYSGKLAHDIYIRVFRDVWLPDDKLVVMSDARTNVVYLKGSWSSSI
jgi:hypothetical protein